MRVVTNRIWLGGLVIHVLLGALAASCATAQQPSNGNNVPQRTNDFARHEVGVPRESMQSVLNSLAETVGRQGRLQSVANGRFQLAITDQTVLLEFSTNAGGGKLQVSGSPQLADSVGRLSTALVDQLTRTDVRVVPMTGTGRTALNQEAVLAATAQGGLQSQAGTQKSTFSLPTFKGFRQVHLASAQQDVFANPSATSPPGGESESNAQADENLRGLPLQQFEGVQVEMLPEIDAIILRGRDKQLEDLAQIIKQLDEASRLAQPEIEVLLLQHVNSQSLSQVLQTIQQSVLALRQGRVITMPLNNPNAVLLIGWGDALQFAKQVIAKLDRPVPASSSFDVIQLKHASATQVQAQLQSFFQSRGNLGPVIQSAVDARTNAIIVHAAPRDLDEIRVLIKRLDVARGEATLQSKVFEIRNSIAADVAASLRQAISAPPGDGAANAPIELLDKDGNSVATSGTLTNSRITVNDRNNSLIVTTSSENLALVEQLIRELDTPGAVAKIKIFPIINADAGALVETLRSLVPSQSPGGAANPQLSSAPDETSLIPLRFTVDGRGNNIIAVGSEGDLKIVEALIVRLDESDTMQRKNTVYQLKNSPAVDIALAVNEFLRSKRQVENSSPGSINPFEQLEREVVVVPEPVQNKLIVSATPRYYEEIRALIEELDQQPPQVMIQVLIAEIALGATHEFGMEMGIQSSVLFDRSLLGDLLTRTTTTSTSTPAGVVTETAQEILAASNTPGFDFNNKPLGNSGSGQSLANAGKVGGQGLSNFAVGRTNDNLGFGGLVLSASSENVSFLLRALQDSQRMEILSRPQILTLDNQPAHIQIGQRIPRVSSANVTQFGFQTGVTLEEVGLILGVTPRISPEGNVVMEINAEKSKLRTDTQGIPIAVAQDGSVISSPILDTIKAEATVSAADGETIILGGLISKETRSVERKVPWLGDIPIVRNLFRYELDEFNRNELLIILTPHVVRSQADMQRVKQAEFARMSWCEADIVDLHGDINAYVGPVPASLESGDWQIIYPDIDPRGLPLDSPAFEHNPLPSPYDFNSDPMSKSIPQANHSPRGSTPRSVEQSYATETNALVNANVPASNQQTSSDSSMSVRAADMRSSNYLTQPSRVVEAGYTQAEPLSGLGLPSVGGQPQ